MRAVNGIPIGQSELVLLIEFLKPDSTVRLTDTHILQAASGLVKKCHIGYTQLALKVAGQLAFEAKAGIPQFRSEIELTTGVGFANRNDAESYIVDGRKQSVYSDEYQLYTMKQIKDAGSYLWDAYGKTGTINPGLIDRANARARVEIDAARSARA